VTLAADTLLVGADDGRLHALDAGSGAERWQFKTGGALRGPTTLAGSDVLLASDDGFVYRLDRATGKERWRAKVAAQPLVRLGLDDAKSRYEYRASGVVAGDRLLYVGTAD